MKILIATDNYYPNVNGASYFVQRLAVQLKNFGNEVVVLAPSRKITDEEFEHNGIKVMGIGSIPVERIRLIIPFAKKKKIRDAINRVKPDVVHIQDHFALCKKATKGAIKLGIPVVGTNHFMPENLVHYLPLSKNLEQRITSWAWQYFLKTFNRLNEVTTPTKTAARLISHIGLNKNAIVISNGIDLKRFNPNNKGEYLMERYKIPSGRKMLLFVGRLDKEKNLDFVIRSFREALVRTKIQLVIVGSGAEKKKLENLARSLNIQEYITFTGFIPDEDLPNLYPLASCFIMAGTAELQSIATMEAMASGLPVLAADAMALPELVSNGENGFLFTLQDRNRLAVCIQKIFTEPDLQYQMSGESLKRIQNHDLEKTVSQFEFLYKNVLSIA